MCFAVLGTLVSAVVFSDSPATPTPVPPSRARLSDYARQHRVQPSQGGDPSAIVISDDNLKEMASGSDLTAVTGESKKPPSPVGAVGPIDPRAFWREKVRAQLAVVRRLETRAQAVRVEISELWEMFYACDVPENRETEIRPRLIRKIDDQVIFDREYEAANHDLQILLGEAQRNGARSGWFRDLLTKPVNSDQND